MAKFIPFRKGGEDAGDMDSLKWFGIALERAPAGAGGLTAADFRKRQRVWNALDKAGADGVILEDADWDTLLAAVRCMRVEQASRAMQALVIAFEDDVAKAEAPKASAI
jgi:hypothetical protein